MEELIKIAQEIQSLNDCLISGSLALSLQKVKLRREPMDIDVFISDREKFKVPEGFKYHEGEDLYSESIFERVTYKKDKIKIDFFWFRESDDSYDLEPSYCYKNKLKLVSKEEVIKFKIEHALDKSYDGSKHKLDVIHILVNN